jgi:hypothetical protein
MRHLFALVLLNFGLMTLIFPEDCTSSSIRQTVFNLLIQSFGLQIYYWSKPHKIESLTTKNVT